MVLELLDSCSLAYFYAGCGIGMEFLIRYVFMLSGD